MPGHELVKLSAGREILIFEAMRLAVFHISEGAAHYLFVNRRELFARAGEETRQTGKTVPDTPRPGRPEGKRPALAGQAVVPFGMRAPAAVPPKRIAQVLFEERDLGLHGKRDVLEICFAPAVGRHTRQDPGASFLVHQAACAVYGIHDHAPHRVRLRCAARQDHLTARQPLACQNNGDDGRDLCLEHLDQRILADAVHSIDCVAL